MKLPHRSQLAFIHSDSPKDSHIIPLTVIGEEASQGMRLLEELSSATVRPTSSLYSLEGSHGWRIYTIDQAQWWVRDQLCGFEGSQSFIWFAAAQRLSQSGVSHFEKSALSLIARHMAGQSTDSQLTVCLLPSPQDDPSHTLNAQSKARAALTEQKIPHSYRVNISLPGACRSSLLRMLSLRSIELPSTESYQPRYPHQFVDDWVSIPPGEVIGENEERWVVTQAFAMGQTQVTQALYEAITHQQLPLRYGPLYPAVAVSWLDAVSFCNQLSALCGLTPYYEIDREQSKVRVIDPKGFGIRLPTRTEWCYAATGLRSWPYAGSNQPEEVAWSAHNSGSKIRPVARLKHNDFGLYDLSGNVWEWSQEGARDEEQEEVCAGDHHPKWLMGGSWANHPWIFPIGEALSELPSYRDEFMGFRIVRTLRADELKVSWSIPKVSAAERRLADQTPQSDDQSDTYLESEA